MTERFEAYCRMKEEAAIAAAIPGYTTRHVSDRDGLVALENEWSRALFDGPFYRSARPAVADVPITSLVFVQSRDGNTGAANPSTLGGGETDLHLVYEGLSRVDADAVLAGAATAGGRDIVFSVWHPELVSLRRARGRPRHPAQVIVTNRGNLRFGDGLMFAEPSLRVFVITRSRTAESIRDRIAGKPWIDVIDAGEQLSFVRALAELRRRGVGVLSCVGGARTATSLINESVVSDIYLTTSAKKGGVPGTPYYDGPPFTTERVVLKEGQGAESGVRFEHWVVTGTQSQV
jgi:riboflavin biosynthesis pyrimidine reductase